jgi:pimeloyl-ACP methyl ester carboxylesterase
MAPDPKFDSTQRTQILRAAMGVRSGSNWRSITLEGCRVAVQDGAENHAASSHPHPIICLHDAGSGSREFRALLENPPAGARFILIDWPGHGRSGDCGVWTADPLGKPTQASAPHLESRSASLESQPRFSMRYCVQILHQVINRLGVRRPILLGSGFGAAVAIRYAADHPSRPLGLVLCQPAGLIPPSGSESATGAAVWRRALKTILPSAAHPGSSAFPANSHARWQALRVAALQAHMQPVIAQADASLRQSAASLKAALRAVHCPVLFAFARESREYRVKRYLSFLEPLLASTPHHRVTVFEGGFHPLWDEPQRFSQAVAGLLNSQLPLEQHKHSWQLSAVDWPTENTNLWKCVHPDCREEQVLPSGQNANDLAPATSPALIRAIPNHLTSDPTASDRPTQDLRVSRFQ